MMALRDLQEPQVALALLAEHARLFPSGVFRSEANLLRVESLLALGRKDEALSVLEHASLASAPNRDEQLVLRGELRASNGRWLEAKEDFDQVLRRHGDGLARVKAQGLQERALWGRSAARSRLGDEVGARSDLDHYLRLFPHGRFAELASRLLQSTP
jgi:tetratricopeptide (TPR) repeat protein